LAKAVEAVIDKDTQLRAVSSWESRAFEAAARAINEVYACARDDVKDHQEISESIRKVLAKIAIAAAGQKIAIELPARALDVGLADILVDQFGISVEDPNYEDVVGKAIGDTVKGKITFNDQDRIFADLNTFFHVDKEISAAKATDRGVVI